jgi:membrane protein insertase Oxa1/YidC/SpoIIIJ
MNDVTKELETITLVPQAPVATEAVIDSKNPNPSTLAWTLGQSIPTKAGTKHIDWSVFGLIVIYALLTIAYQKLMTPPPAATDANDPQAKVMKLLPLVFVGVLFFIPMPAGVLLYLVVTMALMFLQTALVNGQEDRKTLEKAAAKAPASQVVDIHPSSAS